MSALYIWNSSTIFALVFPVWKKKLRIPNNVVVTVVKCGGHREWLRKKTSWRYTGDQSCTLLQFSLVYTRNGDANMSRVLNVQSSAFTFAGNSYLYSMDVFPPCRQCRGRRWDRCIASCPTCPGSSPATTGRPRSTSR